MENMAGFSATGRRLTGPASDLVEMTSENGLRHTAIVFHDEYRGHRAINEALQVVLGFLESPLVTGLAELVKQDVELERSSTRPDSAGRSRRSSAAWPTLATARGMCVLGSS
jgi:hypothetical protein